MPLLEGYSNVYPVEGNIAKIIPSVPLTRPEAGFTKFFALHGYKNLIIGNTSLKESICGGEFCDRQTPTGFSVSESTACGCFYNTYADRIVTQHTLRIKCSKEFSPSEYIIVREFRSHRFDKILFENLPTSLFSDLDNNTKFYDKILREQTNKLVQHVNSHGGWSIIGWVRTGKVQDASEEGNKDAEDIAALDVKPHVVFVSPTNPEDHDKNENQQYCDMQLTEANFTTRLADLQTAAHPASTAQQQETAS